MSVLLVFAAFPAAFILLLTYACCKAASDADDLIEASSPRPAAAQAPVSPLAGAGPSFVGHEFDAEWAEAEWVWPNG